MENNSDYYTSEEDDTPQSSEIEENCKIKEEPIKKVPEKKERKKNSNRNENIGNVIIDKELLNNIKISQAQLKRLKPKKPRSEKQIESAKRLVDLRKQRASEAKAQEEEIRLQVMEKRTYKKKPAKPQVVIESDNDLENSDTLSEKNEKRSYFQARKPKYEIPDEIDEKIEKLNKLNNVLSQNPYYIAAMRHRGYNI